VFEVAIDYHSGHGDTARIDSARSCRQI